MVVLWILFYGLEKWCRFGCSETRYHRYLYQKCDAWAGLTCLAKTCLKWIISEYVSQNSPTRCVYTLCVGDWGETKHFGSLFWLQVADTTLRSSFRGETPRYAALNQQLPEFLADCSDLYLRVCVCSTSIPLWSSVSNQRRNYIFKSIVIFLNQFLGFVLTWLQDLFPVSVNY